MNNNIYCADLEKNMYCKCEEKGELVSSDLPGCLTAFPFEYSCTLTNPSVAQEHPHLL